MISIVLIRIFFIFYFWFLLPVLGFSQIGGRSVYDFLRLTPNARVAALGGENISTFDRDPNFGWFNPALLNDSMHSGISTSVVNYLSDINYGYLGHSRTFQDIGHFHAALQYLNYGKMTETDELGNINGTFSASDISFTTGAARSFGNFRFGTNVKFLYSNIQRFNSFGLALDFGGAWHLPEENTTVAAVIKNIGAQITNFQKNAPKGDLPLDVQIGVSHKLKHLPLRFSTTLIQLHQPRLIQKDPNKKQEFDLAGNPVPEKNQTFDNILRHFVFGGEFLFSKNFHVRVGYNHLRHQELKTLGTNFSLAGVGIGFGLRISKFYLDYGFSNYHAVGGTHSFSITTYLNSFQN